MFFEKGREVRLAMLFGKVGREALFTWVSRGLRTSVGLPPLWPYRKNNFKRKVKTTSSNIKEESENDFVFSVLAAAAASFFRWAASSLALQTSQKG